ncbi:MAG: hypothetical protein ACM3JI_03635 [Anaerolineae bacterium]
MMKKSLLMSAVLGGAIVFIWGAISWMVIPWHAPTMLKFHDEETVAGVIKKNAPEDGIYVLPSYPSFKEPVAKEAEQKEMAELREKMKKGPFIFASVNLHGMDPQSPLLYVRSIIIQMIGAFFVSYLLMHTSGLTYFKRVWFVMITALIAWIICLLPAWNWWGFSTCYVIVALLDLLIGWFLAGLVIAGLIRSKKS